MPVRFRRKRILFLVLLSSFIFIYFINYQITDEIELKSSSSIHEQFVEINEKKLRKIDWHDYEFIARENTRTGILIHL
jgi:hypothetical protein